MKLTTDQLELVKKYAALGFTPEEVAVLIDCDIDSFLLSISDKSKPEAVAFIRASLDAQITVRQSAFDNAASGSTPAQIQIMEVFKKQINSIKSIIGSHE